MPNPYYNPKYHWICNQCGSTISKEVKWCPICKGRDDEKEIESLKHLPRPYSQPLKRNKPISKEEMAKIMREEFTKPLPPYKIKWQDRIKTRKKLQEQLNKIKL